VWGFANDDMHLASQVGLCWNVFLMPELNEEAVRATMSTGRFYFAWSRSGGTPPSLESLVVDREAMTITITATNFTEIKWISGGSVIHVGATFTLSPNDTLEGYVRAEIHGVGGVTYTQPIAIVPEPPGLLMVLVTGGIVASLVWKARVQFSIFHV